MVGMLTFRRAVLDDTPLIEELAKKIFPVTYGEILSMEQIVFMMDWMYSQVNLRDQITEQRHIYHIVYCNGSPVGYFSVQQQLPALWHLQKIYLLPEFQGKGIGKEMFHKAVDYIRHNSQLPCTVELNVNRANFKAISFYERMGMHKASSGDFHIGNGFYMTDYIMAMEIKSC